MTPHHYAGTPPQSWPSDSLPIRAQEHEKEEAGDPRRGGKAERERI